MPDSGSIVLGWLTKLVIALAVIGVIGYDGASLVTANVSTSDHANQYASTGADAFKSTKDVNKAYAMVAADAEAKGDTIDITSFTIAANGYCRLTVHHTATTLWMHRVGFLKKYTVVTAQGEGAPFS